MKVVCVVDSINQLTMKINLLKSRFGYNVLFVVKGDLLNIFNTFNIQANAVYFNNLPRVIHTMLLNSELEDIVVYYTSLDIDNNLLNKFITAIGDRSKIVNFMPKYNAFENMLTSAYNVYVKSIFKTKDSNISPKLQYLPINFVAELLATHFGNRLFETNPEVTRTIQIQEKEISNNFKVKIKPTHKLLIPLIVALLITMALILSLAYIGVSYLLVILFVCLYVLDIIFTIIYLCKRRFDQRFFK